MSLSAEPGKASLPWRLMAVSGLLGLSLAALGPGFHPTTSGRAQLTAVIDPGDPGWQLQLDPRALGFSADRLQATLTSLLGEEISLAGLASDDLVTLSKVQSAGRVIVAPNPDDTLRPRLVVDPLFGGTPSGAFEWSKGAFTVRGNLYARSGAPGMLSGRLVGSLPFSGLRGSGPGFAVDNMGLLPPDVDRLLAIDPTILRFQATYRDAIQKEWDRWEFFPLATLGKAVGPALVYARWRGEALFSIGIQDAATVRAAIDKRFPGSVIRTGARWSYGTRLRGFEPNGPAWLLRGDSLLATSVGGTERLESALAAAFKGAGQFAEPPIMMDEVLRLAATEEGWHAVVIVTEPNSALHWAALVRWPEASGSRVTGYLVVQSLPLTAR